MIFPFRNHLQAYNKQLYSHDVKLPEGRSGEIRFLRSNAVSGSVPRSGNKQSGNIGRWAAGHDQGAEYNI
jgi:hypothetical protein